MSNLFFFPKVPPIYATGVNVWGCRMLQSWQLVVAPAKKTDECKWCSRSRRPNYWVIKPSWTVALECDTRQNGRLQHPFCSSSRHGSAVSVAVPPSGVYHITERRTCDTVERKWREHERGCGKHKQKTQKLKKSWHCECKRGAAFEKLTLL